MIGKGTTETIRGMIAASLLGVRSKIAANGGAGTFTGAGGAESEGRGHPHSAELFLPIPVLGWVPAGWPSPAEEALCDIVSLNEYLITRPESSFLVRVSGDSMTGAGILTGDLVVVERGRTPKNGDIVIAEVDGEWTMKYFRKEGKAVFLEAANPNYPVIRQQRELRIGGVVSAVIRKYHL